MYIQTNWRLYHPSGGSTEGGGTGTGGCTGGSKKVSSTGGSTQHLIACSTLVHHTTAWTAKPPTAINPVNQICPTIV